MQWMVKPRISSAVRNDLVCAHVIVCCAQEIFEYFAHVTLGLCNYSSVKMKDVKIFDATK